MLGQKALASASNLDAAEKAMMEKKFDDLITQYNMLRNSMSAALSGETDPAIDMSLQNSTNLAASEQTANKKLSALMRAAA